MKYIMRRTQLYLGESTWRMLHARARQLRVTISELVRQAIQEKHEKSTADRQEAMRAIIVFGKTVRTLAIRPPVFANSEKTIV